MAFFTSLNSAHQLAARSSYRIYSDATELCYSSFSFFSTFKRHCMEFSFFLFEMANPSAAGFTTAFRFPDDTEIYMVLYWKYFSDKPYYVHLL